MATRYPSRFFLPRFAATLAEESNGCSSGPTSGTSSLGDADDPSGDDDEERAGDNGGDGSEGGTAIGARSRTAAAILEMYCDSLESWRRSMGFPKMILVGHSLGGYFASFYAMKYSERVKRLILLSPIGVPRNSKGVFFSSSSENGAWNSHVGSRGDDQTVDEDEEEQKGWEDFIRRLPPKVRYNPFMRGMGAYIRHLWAGQYGPLTMLRNAGPIGPQLTNFLMKRRFGNFLETWPSLPDYVYQCNARDPSGDRVLPILLKQTLVARWPLEDFVLPSVKHKTDFIFGAKDWMPSDIPRKLSKEHPERVSVHFVEDSGHQLTVENPDATAEVLARILRDEERVNTES